MSTNNVGSHFMQQTLKIFNSKDRTVWLQSIYEKLKGRFLILSTNKSGSFVMETLWSIANLKQRIAIADELKSSEIQLKNDQYVKFHFFYINLIILIQKRYGRFLVNNIGLNFYKRKPDEWKNIQTNEFKKRKMFADLLDSSETTNKKIKNF